MSNNRSQSVWALPTLMLALAIVAACEAPEDDSQELIVECEFDEQPLAWEEASPEGLVPEDVLAVAEGTHEVVGGWTFHDGEVTVQLVVARQGSHAYYLQELGGGCGSRLEIPIALAISVDGDPLHEELEVRGTVDGVGHLTVFASLDPAAVGGAPEPDAGEVTGATLECVFTEDGPTGQVARLVEGQDDEVAWQEAEAVLVW